MSNLFPNGSEWRKWDLHVHPPGTKKNDQYYIDGGDVWEKFCGTIENSDVHAFGITDYFSADGYFVFIEKFRTRYPYSKKVFFANIELCTNDVVNAASEEVNLHVIFNPSVADQKLREFLQALETNKTDHRARPIKAAELSDTRDYEEATTSRKAIDKAIKDTFGDKGDLSEYLLIFTAANNDGIRTRTETVGGKKRGVRRKAVITDEFDKFSHGFLGNSTNTEYFLDPNRLESDDETIPKPVITGSDSHSFDNLENWLGKLVVTNGTVIKQPTWIKGDLTFEGLRQIIFEPADRVFIGDEPEIENRARNNPTKYLESVFITHIDGYDGRHGSWFKDEKLPLNKELVAIIGNKGTGKSALTDIIGLVGNSYNQRYLGFNDKTEELFSFLNKDKFLKHRCATNFTGTLHWYGGGPDKSALDGVTDKNAPEKVEYLPQKYLEKICANIEDDEFRVKLNAVIYGYVDPKDRYDTTSLEELLEYLTSQATADIESTKQNLHEVNEEIVSLEKRLVADYRKEIEERINVKQREIDSHNSLKPAVVPKPPERDQSALQIASELDEIDIQIERRNEDINDLKSEQGHTTKQVEDLKHARTEIERQVNSLTRLKGTYQNLLGSTGITFDEIVTVTTDFQKLDNFIQTKQSRINDIENSLVTEEDINNLPEDTAERQEAITRSLPYQRSQLENRKKELVELLDKPNREYQAYLKADAQWQTRLKELMGADNDPAVDTRNWLTNELQNIKDVYSPSLKTARARRDEVSKELFLKKKTLITFYNSVKKSIDAEIKKYRVDLGGYDIAIEAGLRFDPAFYEEFFKYVNQGVKGSFYGTDDGKTVLQGLCSEAVNWQEDEQALAAITRVVEHLDHDMRTGLSASEDKTRDIFKQLKQQKKAVLFYDYLFGFDYLKPKYDLKVDGKDLSELSPGERGALLLIFYLMLDKRDIPLVIDQPEDNLDNKSVYEILVKFLKKAKRRRQIIMATHNPNLAVVADAEQIIHVSIDKKKRNDFDFYSGSIENPEINKRVVDILEGTRPAFDNRRLKYRK